MITRRDFLKAAAFSATTICGGCAGKLAKALEEYETQTGRCFVVHYFELAFEDPATEFRPSNLDLPRQRNFLVPGQQGDFPQRQKG